MAVNQVIVGDEVKLDLTADTVSEDNLLAGATAHNAAGEPIEGAVVVAPIDSELSDTSENPVQNKAVFSALSEKASSSHSHSVADISDFPEISGGGNFKIITGTYIGTGKSVSCLKDNDDSVTQEDLDSVTINIGETPVAVIISEDAMVSMNGITKVLVQGNTCWYMSNNPYYEFFKIVDNGFIANRAINVTGSLYKYIALIQS